MNKGFIALTITLSVAGTLLALVAVSVIGSTLFFDQALRKQYRAMNYYNAGDCIDQAVLTLAHDYFFLLNSPREIKYFNCSILSVVANGELRTISARGDLQKAYVYRSAIVRLSPSGLEVVKIE